MTTTLPIYDDAQNGAGGSGDAPERTRGGRPRQWLSLEAYEGTASYRERAAREFPEGATELPTTALSRRKFMQLLGASAMLAGAQGCDIIRRPVKHVVPYDRRPEEILPGIPNMYASAFSRSGYGLGVVVRCNEGRPTKIEGNPDHPASAGKTGVHAQASILELYDPERSRTVKKRDGDTWKESDTKAFFAWFDAHLEDPARARGEKLAFVTPQLGSPTAKRLRELVTKRFPAARFVAWEPINRDNVFAGAEIAFGRALDMRLRLDRAKRVVALDSDFSSADDDAVRQLRDFASQRHAPEAGGETNRLYVVEPHYTPSASLADHRLRLRAGEIGPFLEALAGALIEQGLAIPALDADLKKRFEKARARTYPKNWHVALAKDLLANRGRSAIVVGARQPAWVHALAFGINEALGNLGSTIELVPPVDPQATAQTRALGELAKAMAAGAVDTLVIWGQNPVYDAPADFEFEKALTKVEHVVRLGLYEDESSEHASWHVPEAHWLASWGDERSIDGALALRQPLIAPLYGGVSGIELLAHAAGLEETDPHALVRETWRGFAPANARNGDAFDRWVRARLHAGVIAGTAFEPITAKPRWKEIGGALDTDAGEQSGFELAFAPCAKVYDGRYANNAWLQEMPDPVTKLTWDNAALISPKTAKELGLESGSRVELQVGERKLEAAAWVMPGHADGALTMALGYGRRRIGKVGLQRGFDAYRLRTSNGMGFVGGVKLRKLTGAYPFACVQDHHDTTLNRGSGDMHDRPIVREVSLATLLSDEFEPAHDMKPEEAEIPKDPETGEPIGTLWEEPDYSKGQQWGMSIDLNACNGCNACLIACQSENNVPVVGKEDVIHGREMHWIRLDRYFVGDPEEPEMVQQPMPCQQCEMAPCEQVCPVAATSHSPDGLNDMAYNRCIGTRYCSNNCPFKVRRFNYFNYSKRMFALDPLPLANNPDVTVRFRGVMEKCTYCVQRIRRAQQDAKNAGKDHVEDGAFTTACAQACPADAIVFGDINATDTRVVERKRSKRNYTLFPELNIQPRTSYLARVRNPNPELV